MRIDRRLNLVIPIERDDGSVIYAHSTPISSEVFDVYHRPIARTFAQLYADGLGLVGGGRIADKYLRDIAKEMGMWDDNSQTKTAGVERGLIGEIRRLTNIMAPGERGWELLPVEDARKKDLISAQEAQEVDAAAVFFSVASAMHRKSSLKDLVDVALQLLDARTESLSCTEFLSSLPTSTEAASTGAKAAA